MRRQHHPEHHFTAPETIRDIVIGMSDGLTVPFALAAGLSGAGAMSSIIVIAGLAEIAAGAISMGLGGYLAARTDREHYKAEREREWRETEEMPKEEEAEVAGFLRQYGLEKEPLEATVGAIRSDRNRWVDFMMRFELGLEKPDPHRARASAATIAVSYAVGGFVPLSPYLAVHHVPQALALSVGVTLAALGIFGAVKARFTDGRTWRGMWQTMLIGGIAAGAAFALARLIA